MTASASFRVLIFCIPLAMAAASQPVSPTKADIAFVDQAILDGLFEIRSAEIAMHRNLTPQEMAFANEVASEHIKINKELGDLARMKSIAAPEELPAGEQEKLLAMAKMDDREFNESFLKKMITSHKDSLERFGDEQSSSRDPDLRPFAAKTLPQLQLHLDTARQLVARY